ncbi:hypothetical protein BC834DRAFT_210787 [Gloeopeniophorella convolvens]|nr:hypothetical protein BC834DRAFT_210787 [Gloeopeniophorella convolvens]
MPLGDPRYPFATNTRDDSCEPLPLYVPTPSTPNTSTTIASRISTPSPCSPAPRIFLDTPTPEFPPPSYRQSCERPVFYPHDHHVQYPRRQEVIARFDSLFAYSPYYSQ